MKIWVTENHQYSKPCDKPRLREVIFFFLRLKLIWSLFKSVFQHFSPTPAQVINKQQKKIKAPGYFPHSSDSKCLRSLSGILYKKETHNHHDHWYKFQMFWATNTFACYVKASESWKLGKVMFFFFFSYNPRVNIKQTAILLWALWGGRGRER